MSSLLRALLASTSDLIQVSVEVHDELNQHGWCFVEFRATNDNRPPVESWLGQPVAIEASDESGTSTIFQGIVWQAELHHDVKGGYNVVVTGVTVSWKLEVTHDQNAFKNMTLSSIAQQLVGIDGVTARVAVSADAPWPYLVQWGISDMAFLASRTYERRAWMHPSADGIDIRDSFEQSHPLKWAERLVHFALIGRIGTPSCSGTHYDPGTTKSQTLKGITQAPTFLSASPMSSATLSASQAALPSGGLYRGSHATTQLDLQFRLQTEALRNLSHVYVIGVSREPAVAAGKALQIEGLRNGDGDGSCGVVRVVHAWTQAGGYKNEFFATMASLWLSGGAPRQYPPARVWQIPDRPGLLPTGTFNQGGGSPASLTDPQSLLWYDDGTCARMARSVASGHSDASHPYLGVVVARVVDNNDPEHLGRLKVQYIWSEDPTDWIRLATPNAGADRGFLFLPEIGDEVVVAFEDGDPNHPVIIGSLWNSANNNQGTRHPFVSPEGVANNDVKRIITKSGMRITFSDTAGQQGLTFVTPFGASIKMLQTHPGTTFPMISLETPTGDIFLHAPEGRIHLKSKFYSKEVG